MRGMQLPKYAQGLRKWFLLQLMQVMTFPFGGLCKGPRWNFDSAKAFNAHLVHDNVVDSVLIIVFVVTQPHGKALRVISLKVLHKS